MEKCASSSQQAWNCQMTSFSCHSFTYLTRWSPFRTTAARYQRRLYACLSLLLLLLLLKSIIGTICDPSVSSSQTQDTSVCIRPWFTDLCHRRRWIIWVTSPLIPARAAITNMSDRIREENLRFQTLKVGSDSAGAAETTCPVADIQYFEIVSPWRLRWYGSASLEEGRIKVRLGKLLSALTRVQP